MKERIDVPSGQLLVLHLLANACSADETIVLAALAGEFSVTLMNGVSFVLCRRDGM